MVTIDVPVKFKKWFEKYRQWPVKVHLTDTTGQVVGGQPYKLWRVSAHKVVAYRQVGQTVLPAGEMTPQGLLRPVSDAAKHDLGAIRAAIFRTSYPAPLAYEMGNRDLVHPGECFNKHVSVLIRRTLYSVGNEEHCCAICKEVFE
jgi:hypothetical protein